MTFAQLRAQTEAAAKGETAAQPVPAPKPAPVPAPKPAPVASKVADAQPRPRPEFKKPPVKAKPAPAPEPEVEEISEETAAAIEEIAEVNDSRDVANDVAAESTTAYGSVMALIEQLQAALPEGVTISISGKSAA
jgi:outer membrane biosynthesis protein TonB